MPTEFVCAAQPRTPRQNTIDRMARAILSATDLTGGCTEADLVAAGFSAGEVGALGNAAVGRALDIRAGLAGTVA